jgi:hypothetical protein
LQTPVRPAGLSEEALRLFDEGGEEQFAMRGLGGAGTARDFRLIIDLISRAHALAEEQHFHHWQIAFPYGRIGQAQNCSMGYLNKDGSVKPPIIWNEIERRHLRARLDALHFILFGVTDDDDIRYVLSTFPIIERKDRESFDGVYLTRELILWYKRALEAGDAESTAPEAELIRVAKTRAN